MPATFDEFGLRFLYPDNWTSVVDEEEGGNSATLQLPSGGFCSIVRDQSQNLDEQLVDEIRDAIIVEYNEVESEILPIDSFFDNGLAVDLKFYYLDLLIMLRTLHGHQRCYVSPLGASPGWQATKPWLAPKRPTKSAVCFVAGNWSLVTARGRMKNSPLIPNVNRKDLVVQARAASVTKEGGVGAAPHCHEKPLWTRPGLAFAFCGGSCCIRGTRRG